MKILFLTNIPSPYMVDFFNELGKLCQLKVLFEKHTASDRDKSWDQFKFKNFEGIIMGGSSTSAGSAFCPQVIRYIIKNTYDHIIVTNLSTPTGILAIEYMKIKKIPFILESEGGFAKNGKGLKEKFKKHLLSGAKLYFSTTKVGDDYFLTYGAVKEKIVKYPFTSLFQNDLLLKPLKKEEKEEIKTKLGLRENKIVLSVGQFIKRKGYDILLNACVNINPDAGVYIAGGIPTQEYLDLKNKLKLGNIHFLEFMSKVRLKEYYKAADLFVLPTREDIWGLVINEAMSCALPVITTDMCVAGLELVKNDENGFIIPIGDEKLLAEKINTIINNAELRDKMAQSSLEKIQWYTYENMAKRHIEILSKLG